MRRRTWNSYSSNKRASRKNSSSAPPRVVQTKSSLSVPDTNDTQNAVKTASHSNMRSLSTSSSFSTGRDRDPSSRSNSYYKNYRRRRYSSDHLKDGDDDSEADLSSMLMTALGEENQQPGQGLDSDDGPVLVDHTRTSSVADLKPRNSFSSTGSHNNVVAASHPTAAAGIVRGRRRSSFHTQKIEPTKRSSAIPDDLPIAKLKTSPPRQLYGRQTEIKILQQCYQNMIEQKTPRQLVLISGYSGVGKSALAASLKHTCRKQNGIYAKGKFDINSNSSTSNHTTTEPYQAIAMACREICGAILFTANTNLKDFQDLQRNIPRVLGKELPLLIQLIPALEEIVYVEDTTTTLYHQHSFYNKHGNTITGDNSNIDQDEMSSTEAKHRITYALQRFFRLVTKQFHSLILVIDDLQWADESTLQVMDKVLKDSEIQDFMLIGIYRSNEVDDKHLLQHSLEQWQSRGSNSEAMASSADDKEASGRSIMDMNISFDSFAYRGNKETSYGLTEIQLGNLKLPAVISVIRHMLGMTMHHDDNHSDDNNDGRKLVEINAAAVAVGDDISEITNNDSTAANIDGTLSLESSLKSHTTTSTNDSSSRNSNKVYDLGQLCYEKTDGNIFFLRLFLSTLYEKKLLYYNIGSLKWVWNSAEIHSTIPATDNIVDLLKSNIKKLPSDNQEILKLASCLGSTFPLSLLETIILVLSDDPKDNRKSIIEAISLILQNLIKEGYLIVRYGGNSDGSGMLQFSHDQIQQTSFMLLSSEERPPYQYRLGRLLLETLYGPDRDMAIFIIAELLNKGITTNREGKTVLIMEEDEEEDMVFEIANLNGQACRKAFGLCAFEAAADYASKAIQLLSSYGNGDDDKWETHYELSLDLYSMGAAAENYLGHFSKTNQYCSEVLALKSKPIEDKFRIYHTLFDSIGNGDKGRMDECAQQILELLEVFRVRIPKSKVVGSFWIVSNLVQLKYNLKSWWSIESIKQLPATEDPVRIELCRLLDKLATAFYVIGDPRMTLAIFRSLRWTQKYGINKYSPTAVATGAMVVVGVLEDLKGGEMMGKSALKLLDVVDSRHLVESRVIACLYSFVFHWSAPLQDMLRPLLQGYEAGLNCGDTESASICIRFFVSIRQILGTPLERVEKDAKTYALQMKELERMPVYRALLINRQQWLNMMGKGTNGSPLVLDGDSIVAEELDRIRKEDVFIDNEAKRCEDLLCFYFGAHEKLAKSVLTSNGADLPFMGSAVLIHHAVSRGVSSFAAYNLTGRKSYLKMGMLMRSKVKSWLEKGCPNVLHIAPFLDAEYEVATCKGGDLSLATKRFESAVLISARNGNLLDAAIVSERFGEMYLNQLKDEENASFRLCQAIRYYKEADAYGKVDDLEAKYGYLMARPKEILTTSTMNSEYAPHS